MYPCHLRSVDERLAALRADSHMVAGGEGAATSWVGKSGDCFPQLQEGCCS